MNSTQTCNDTACDAGTSHESTTLQKAAIIVLSDPQSGSKDEALGRVFNALAAAYDFKQRGHDVTVQFQGAGTRWLGELVQPNHPAHQLYKEIEDTIAGLSCGCADVFGGTEDAKACGLDLITDNDVPGTSGLPSLASMINEGRNVITF